MSNEAPDPSRRRFLTGAASVVGGVGAVFAAVPFLGFLKPNVEAQAVGAPIEVDVGKLASGQRLEFTWKGSPVWVIARSQEHLDKLKEEGLLDKLRDPESEADQQPAYVDDLYRSVDPGLLVISPVCTHLGCIVVYHPEIEPKPFDEEWRGGFFCACHGAMYDMAGRVYSGTPAPLNLVVPPHRNSASGKLVIGEDPKDPEQEVEAS